MTSEYLRLQEAHSGRSKWKKFGPYVSDRQWGTVREDYSPDGSAWEYSSHDMARSKAYRWGEEGIGGISDDQQIFCFAIALWNKKDPILKERYFGLTAHEGNHGEDVKEYYYYLDNTPTHSYMKMLYKYPQQEFPYSWLVNENKRRTKLDPEFELIDTGIFNDDKYFDVFVEYSKKDPNDLLIKITIHNRGKENASLHVLPTLWFRNTWSWGYDNYRPSLSAADSDEVININHRTLGDYFFYFDKAPSLLFCDNEINVQRLYNAPMQSKFCKDGINDFLLHGNGNAVNPDRSGTKASGNYDLNIGAGKSSVIRMRLSNKELKDAFSDFDKIFIARQNEADEFYSDIQKDISDNDKKLVQRQALAGMLWTKQFYYFDVDQWLKGDPGQPPPPRQRFSGRNHDWKHLNTGDIISMPDKWEFPWFASWDLAFHCAALAMVDVEFAKKQLVLLTREWYMHPNGQLPAYEWSFDDVNPPVHAWATWRVYKMEKHQRGAGDTVFLESIFLKMLLNFTWWVNKKDAEGNNLFQGGFLGLDNIGVFDRGAQLPEGGYIEQSDGTSWMAMFSLNMMVIALELSKSNPVYQDMATKFFEHFLYIAGAMASMGINGESLWDEEDEFFYDVLRLPNNTNVKLKVRSMVGLIPLFAVEVLEDDILCGQKEFAVRLKWFLDNRPDLAALVSRWQEKGTGEMHLLSLLRGHRMKRLLKRMLDENEFLSEYGVRSVSKYHEVHPYQTTVDGQTFTVKYAPGESDSGLFGGNSNWRGPVWMPMNYLLIESLHKFHHYYGDNFKVEYPTNSGKYLSLNEIAIELSRRLSSIFLFNENMKRPVFGQVDKFQQDIHFKNYILFYECFHGDNGRGVGASHQTGWTGLIAKILASEASEAPVKPDLLLNTEQAGVEKTIM